jgi:hypothetical protein
MKAGRKSTTTTDACASIKAHKPDEDHEHASRLDRKPGLMWLGYIVIAVVAWGLFAVIVGSIG